MFLASFVEKNIFDLEISGGHFVFALKKFRPRVPKWHPADFCSGCPIVSESIIKHRPYRETRFSQNPLDYDASSETVTNQAIPRRTTRKNAGEHSNPHRLNRSVNQNKLTTETAPGQITFEELGKAITDLGSNLGNVLQDSWLKANKIKR